MSSHDDLPKAIPAMWRALVRGYRAEPRLLPVAFGFSLLAALPDALLALWLKLLADGVLQHQSRACPGCGSGTGEFRPRGTWFLRVISDRTQRRFRERVTVALESHVARLQASVVSIEHHERPEFLNRLAMLRDQVFVLDHMYMSLFSTCGWILRLGVTLVLLDFDPPRARAACGLCAADGFYLDVAAGRRAYCLRKRLRRANRLARHLFVLATTAPAGKEVRVTGIGQKSGGDGGVRRGSGGTRRWRKRGGVVRGGIRWRGRFSAPGLSGAVAFVSMVARAAPGNVLLVLAAGSRLSAYIGATVGEIGFLRGIWLDGSKRLAWLEDYAAAQEERRRRAGAGETLERDSFRARLVRLSRARSGWCSRMCAWNSGRARWWPSWARTVRARPRW